MSKIHLLDDLTANQIAAGEVIERPVSVVKELVENALDAGSHNIVVDILQGGITLIRVSDDGCGMSKDDVKLALKRHATSKLQTLEDLDSLRTLGFRGEALPSIVSVAKVEIVTREYNQLHGTKVILTGDNIASIEPAGAPAGTSIAVYDLFYNTPARRKFMRSQGYEAGLIHELMQQFSLSHPSVNFRLNHQGKQVLNTTGIDKTENLLQLFYGKSISESIIKLEAEISSGYLSGVTTQHTYCRANRKGIYFFLNSRRVFSPELLSALQKAYENVLPKGKFPVAVFHIELEPSLIDVNVHPSKLEVRFRETAFIEEITDIVKNNLDKQKQIPHYELHLPKPTFTNEKIKSQESWKEFFTWQPNHKIEQASAEKSQKISDDVVEKVEAESRAEDDALVKEAAFFEPSENRQGEKINIGKNINIFNENETLTTPDVYNIERKVSIPKEVVVPPQESLPTLKIIGQLANTFILAEGKEGLYIIDQHVAHERVLFEQLVKQAEEGTVESQVLLTPVTLQLSMLEEQLVIDKILPLTDLGIILENFGPRTYLLRAVPACLKENPETFFFELLQRLDDNQKLLTPADIRIEFLTTASCKGAIKARHKLSWEDMHNLLEELSKTVNPMTCPHGRPIIYQIPYKDILKAFHRSSM